MARRRILSLDGGGVRGIVTLAFLARLERRASEKAGRAVRLCEMFDLIGGTSTGAIIATALALGLRVEEIVQFYRELAPKVFRKSRLRLTGVQSVFDGSRLRRELEGIIGAETRLDTPRLKTGLAIIAKRLDTGGVWLLTNNPKAKYWDDPPDGSYIGNRHFRLVDIVRASTAAPHFFAPEQIEIISGTAPGLFVDGGVTPYNNPALALLQLATIPAHGYGWPVGAEKLAIVSVGTGAFRQRLDAKSAHHLPAAVLALRALTGLIQDGEQHTLTLMQLLGEAIDPVWLNSEIGDLSGERLVAPLFTFQRYDMPLERGWLERELGAEVSEKQLARLRQMEEPKVLPQLWELAGKAAEKLVKAEQVERIGLGG